MIRKSKIKTAMCLLFVALTLFSYCKLKPSKTETGNADTISSGLKQITDSIQISYFDVEPHVFIDKKTGRLSGALYDLIENYISPEIGIKFIWDTQPTAITRQLETLKYTTYYAAAVLIKTPDRIKFLTYADRPYFKSKSAISFRSDYPIKKINNIENLLNIKIGYADNAFITPFVSNPKMNFDFVYEPNYHETNFKKLLANRIDGVYAPDKAALLAISKRMNISNKIRTIDLPENETSFYVVFSKDSTDIVKKFNKAAKKLNAQKLYYILLTKYIDTSDL